MLLVLQQLALQVAAGGSAMHFVLAQHGLQGVLAIRLAKSAAGLPNKSCCGQTNRC